MKVNPQRKLVKIKKKMTLFLRSYEGQGHININQHICNVPSVVMSKYELNLQKDLIFEAKLKNMTLSVKLI